jgi:hypothetical protein
LRSRGHRLYPLAVTGLGRFFPSQANGSGLWTAGRAPPLIGSPDDPRYFWGRPSATGGFPNNAAASSARSQSDNALAGRRAHRALRAADPGNTARCGRSVTARLGSTRTSAGRLFQAGAGARRGLSAGGGGLIASTARAAGSAARQPRRPPVLLNLRWIAARR